MTTSRGRACWALVFSLVCACPFATANAADGLPVLSETVHTPPPPSPSPPPSRDDDHDHGHSSSWFDYGDCCDCDSGDELLAWGFVMGITSPFWGPPAMMGDDYSVAHDFANYPHECRNGYLLPTSCMFDAQGQEVDPSSLIAPRSVRSDPIDRGAINDNFNINRNYWALRSRLEYGTNFDHIDWIGAHLLWESTTRFGLEADFRWLDEAPPSPFPGELGLGDMNIFFRFAQCSHMEMRTGIGLNYLVEPGHTDVGFNFTYAADWYPTKPVVVSAELDLGWLGQASLVHFRATTGVNYKRAESFLGYDYYDIGAFQLEGFVVGVRLWY